MIARLLSVLSASLLAATTTMPAQPAPMPPPRDIAERVADCMTRELSEWVTGPGWVEELQAGYRVVLPLRGDPIAHENAQFPPPAEDTLAWIDLHRYDDSASAPAGLVEWERDQKFYARRSRVEFFAGDPVYVVELGGYDWYTLGWMTVDCLDEARGG